MVCPQPVELVRVLAEDAARALRGDRRPERGVRGPRVLGVLRLEPRDLAADARVEAPLQERRERGDAARGRVVDVDRREELAAAARVGTDDGAAVVGGAEPAAVGPAVVGAADGAAVGAGAGASVGARVVGAGVGPGVAGSAWRAHGVSTLYLSGPGTGGRGKDEKTPERYHCSPSAALWQFSSKRPVSRPRRCSSPVSTNKHFVGISNSGQNIRKTDRPHATSPEWARF